MKSVPEAQETASGRGAGKGLDAHEDAARPVAVFDLDVTLTRYDTYLPFLNGYLRRHPRRWLHLPRLGIRWLVPWRWLSRDWIKNAVLRSCLGGEPRERVADWAADFAGHIYRRAMRPSGLQRLRWHQSRGDRVILASASLDVYVTEIAALLDVPEVLATRVGWDSDDRLVGIHGANCRDQQKLARIQHLLGAGADGKRVTAYSDSHADVPLLSWAETGVAVCPSRRLFHQVAGLGLEIQRW